MCSWPLTKSTMRLAAGLVVVSSMHAAALPITFTAVGPKTEVLLKSGV